MNDEKQTAVDWKQLYRAALLETDPQLAAKLMEQAEQAIVARALALHQENTGNNMDELKSLAYSANFLSELRRVEVDAAKRSTSP